MVFYYFLFLTWYLIPNSGNNVFHCPPGTIAIGDNFFVDRNEISIHYYREYLYWIKRVFGSESDFYNRSLPDFSVYDSIANSYGITSTDFFFDPEFADYPVIGLKFSQAANFCQWRSDRVYEFVLVNKGVIDLDTNQNQSTFFTIQKHLEDNPKNFLKYPEYRLPSPDEWDAISQHKKVKKEFESALKPHTNFNQNKIFNFFGSLSEMTSVIGISKGGSYKDGPWLMGNNWEKPYVKQSDWLGFRCVCSWKK